MEMIVLSNFLLVCVGSSLVERVYPRSKRSPNTNFGVPRLGSVHCNFYRGELCVYKNIIDVW